MEYPIPVVVACVYRNNNSEILLGKRLKPQVEKWLYGFPGGKVHFGEILLEALKRELVEETSLTIQFGYIPRFLGFIEAIIPKVGHFVEFFYEINAWCGEPKLCEPEKCLDWGWYNVKTLSQLKQSYTLTKFIERFT